MARMLGELRFTHQFPSSICLGDRVRHHRAELRLITAPGLPSGCEGRAAPGAGPVCPSPEKRVAQSSMAQTPVAQKSEQPSSPSCSALPQSLALGCVRCSLKEAGFAAISRNSVPSACPLEARSLPWPLASSTAMATEKWDWWDLTLGAQCLWEQQQLVKGITGSWAEID